MDPRYRQLFNAQFTPEHYASMQHELERRLECAFEFRLAETPLFMPADFEERIVEAANAIVAQLSDPARIAAMKRAIPARWDTPGMDALPNFTQVDFAVVRDGDAYVPKLIELQGFPSLTAFQVVQRDVWRDVLRSMDGLDRPWSCWFSGLDRDVFLRLAAARSSARTIRTKSCSWTSSRARRKPIPTSPRRSCSSVSSRSIRAS